MDLEPNAQAAQCSREDQKATLLRAADEAKRLHLEGRPVCDVALLEGRLREFAAKS